MDESGHDHRHLPYEVRGGICVEVKQVWSLTQQIRRLEFDCFGGYLRDYGSEIKATKVLEKKRFKWANSAERFSPAQRRELSRQFLAQTARNVNPTPEAWWAYGQASIELVRGLVRLLIKERVPVFASMIPKGTGKQPPNLSTEYVRKDLTFLFERFYYFLEDRDDDGILVFDETDRTDDRRSLRRIESYFAKHTKGKLHSGRILPSPLFVGSDMSYAIQAADVVIYVLATAYRPKNSAISATQRDDVAQLVGGLLPKLIYHASREAEDGTPYRSGSVFMVPDPWGTRK